MSEDFKSVFLAYCDACKKGSSHANDKVLKKMCTDAKITSAKFDQNSVDIAFRKFLGNAKKECSCEEMQTFIRGILADAYVKANGGDQATAGQALMDKICSSSPKCHGATKSSADPTTSRLTDPSKYTGSHKERFNEDGTGKGIEGRVDRDAKAAEGYVSGYKGKGTYDAK